MARVERRSNDLSVPSYEEGGAQHDDHVQVWRAHGHARFLLDAMLASKEAKARAESYSPISWDEDWKRGISLLRDDVEPHREAELTLLNGNAEKNGFKIKAAKLRKEIARLPRGGHRREKQRQLQELCRQEKQRQLQELSDCFYAGPPRSSVLMSVAGCLEGFLLKTLIAILRKYETGSREEVSRGDGEFLATRFPGMSPCFVMQSFAKDPERLNKLKALEEELKTHNQILWFTTRNGRRPKRKHTSQLVVNADAAVQAFDDGNERALAAYLRQCVRDGRNIDDQVRLRFAEAFHERGGRSKFRFVLEHPDAGNANTKLHTELEMAHLGHIAESLISQVEGELARRAKRDRWVDPTITREMVLKEVHARLQAEKLYAAYDLTALKSALSFVRKARDIAQNGKVGFYGLVLFLIDSDQKPPE